MLIGSFSFITLVYSFIIFDCSGRHQHAGLKHHDASTWKNTEGWWLPQVIPGTDESGEHILLYDIPEPAWQRLFAMALQKFLLDSPKIIKINKNLCKHFNTLPRDCGGGAKKNPFYRHALPCREITAIPFLPNSGIDRSHRINSAVASMVIPAPPNSR